MFPVRDRILENARKVMVTQISCDFGSWKKQTPSTVFLEETWAIRENWSCQAILDGCGQMFFNVRERSSIKKKDLFT